MFWGWVIYGLSTLVWMLPPFRQYKTPYFRYFLLLGFIDPITFIAKRIWGLPYSAGTVLFTIAIIYAMLIREKDTKLSIGVFLLFFIPSSIVVWSFPEFTRKWIVLMMQLFLIGIVMKDLFVIMRETFSVPIFLIVLLGYLFSIVFKIYNVVSNPSTGVMFYYTTLFFEMVVALFFCIFNIENSPIISMVPTVEYELKKKRLKAQKKMREKLEKRK